MRRFRTLCLLSASALLCTACAASPANTPTEPVPKQKARPPVTFSTPAPDPVETLLASLTLVEKVGQVFFVRCPSQNAVSDVADYHLGGYILFGRDFKDKSAEQVRAALSSYQDASDIPLLLGVDEEGGTVVRVSSNPQLRSHKFASPQRLYAQGGWDAIRSDTAEKDALLSSLGINVNLAPVADVSTDPSDFIYARSFGQDAAATAEYVRTVVTQMQADGMGSVLKHFPGYSSNPDTHTGIAIDQRPYETFVVSDFLPFQIGYTTSTQTTAILISHNIIQNIDSTLPASLSPIVHNILREELGFDGVAMTDDLAMDAAAAYAADGSAAVLALQAGNDLIVTTDYRMQIPQVLQAVETGTLSTETIDEACRRVLTWKAALGLLENSTAESAATSK